MHSKAKIAGHPLHPMLVAFPVAFYTASLVCFAAYAIGKDPLWFRIGVYANVAGVITAAVASLPGFIDWAFAIPAGSPAKATGLVHMLCNVAALLLFAVNVSLQWRHRFEVVPPIGASVALTGVGVVLTVIAGFLGWKMVQKHHVGVELTPEQERLEPHSSPRAERTPSERAGRERHA